MIHYEEEADKYGNCQGKMEIYHHVWADERIVS
jgi:hypothetical protein